MHLRNYFRLPLTLSLSLITRLASVASAQRRISANGKHYTYFSTEILMDLILFFHRFHRKIPLKCTIFFFSILARKPIAGNIVTVSHRNVGFLTENHISTLLGIVRSERRPWWCMSSVSNFITEKMSAKFMWKMTENNNRRLAVTIPAESIEICQKKSSYSLWMEKRTFLREGKCRDFALRCNSFIRGSSVLRTPFWIN